MRLCLTTALLLASLLAAQAQQRSTSTGGTPASQMAARANANANQARDTAVGAAISLSPDDTPAQPSDGQRIIRGSVNGTPADPVLHYPYGRYQPTLGNVDPNSLANPFTRAQPSPVTSPVISPVISPVAPSLRTNVPAFSPGFGTSPAPAFSRGR